MGITLVEISNEIKKDWDISYTTEISDDDSKLYVWHGSNFIFEVSEGLCIDDLSGGVYDEEKKQLEFMINRF